MHETPHMPKEVKQEEMPKQGYLNHSYKGKQNSHRRQRKEGKLVGEGTEQNGKAGSGLGGDRRENQRAKIKIKSVAAGYEKEVSETWDRGGFQE